jgi:hypothetical protein
MRKDHLPPQDMAHVFCPQCNYNLSGQPSEPAEWPSAHAWCPGCRREFTVHRERKGATTYHTNRLPLPPDYAATAMAVFVVLLLLALLVLAWTRLGPLMAIFCVGVLLLVGLALDRSDRSHCR